MKYQFLLLIFTFVLKSSGIAQADTSTKIERPCPSTFIVYNNSKSLTLRYAINHPITVANKNIKQLMIYIHGASRNGLDYYEWGEASVKAADKNEETLLIVPQFTSERDLNAHNHDATHLFWANNNWRSGDESVSSKKRIMTETISSFSLIDSFIAQACVKKLFPHLKKVVVIGHSAGGQFVQRYACMTPMPEILRGYTFRFILMNPSSYLYFDDRRPMKKGDILSFARPDSTGCGDFNTYPKGFKKLNPYAAKAGADKIKQQFLNRDITFLMGGSDTNMNDPSMDKSCSGNMQGRYRLERGQFFYEYVKLFSKKTKLHHFDIVPNVAHSGEKMVNNALAWKYLFDMK